MSRGAWSRKGRVLNADRPRRPDDVGGNDQLVMRMQSPHPLSHPGRLRRQRSSHDRIAIRFAAG
jgi:hypothetical protein